MRQNAENTSERPSDLRYWHWDDWLVLPLLALLRLYRRFLSPLLGPSCRFEPSCSRYASLALCSHSLPRALGLISWRLLRCQPFGRPGLDPVPPPTRLRLLKKPKIVGARGARPSTN